MKWGNNDLGLELYVATEQYPDSKQYQDSQYVLSLIKVYGLDKKIDIIKLNKLDEQTEFFPFIKLEPEKEAKLPFLVCTHACHPVSMLGYSGLEEVIDMLNSPLLASLRENKQIS